jgi:hypothetical protein
MHPVDKKSLKKKHKRSITTHIDLPRELLLQILDGFGEFGGLTAYDHESS